jgi:hypothetical protein
MHIILSWKEIGFGWRTSKLISIDAGRQPTIPVNDVEHHMEARPVATKDQGDFGHEFLGSQKAAQGRSLRISPTPL